MNIGGYKYRSSETNCSHEYLLPTLFKILEEATRAGLGRRIFEVGCGSGAVASILTARGYEVSGVDPSIEGIAQANRNFLHLSLKLGSTELDLAKEYGTFPIVLSLEVVEHVFLPREYGRRLYDLLEPGGIAIISTPYHSYLKNLVMALTGKMDAHFTALWDYGHIKFWSRKTLSALLREVGFTEVEFHRVGRIPQFAKSMIAVARKSSTRAC